MARKVAQGKQLLAAMVEVLANEPIRGYTNKELSELTQAAPPYITRAMQELIDMGWAAQDLATKRIHLTARLSRLFSRVATAFDREDQRLADAKHNYLN